MNSLDADIKFILKELKVVIYKWSIKDLAREISQNLQEKICAGVSFK